MDYKKAYKEALNRAKHALDCHNQGMVSTDVSLITSMFPELKESEDEIVRKSIIRLLQRGGYMSSEDKDKAFAWLEKQEKQKQEWSEEDEEMTEDLIKGCVSASQQAHHFLHTPKEVSDWLDSLKNRVQGKED